MNLPKLHLHWTVRKKGNKEYKTYYLARSYRKDGKVRKGIIYKLGSISEERVIEWKNFLLHTRDIADKSAADKIPSLTSTGGYTVDDFYKILENQSYKKFEYDPADQKSDWEFMQEVLKDAFSGVADPREQDNFSYPFYGMLLMILAGTLSSAKSILAIHEYACEKAAIFLPLLGIKKIPSYMVFWWIITRCNTTLLNQAFLRWLKLLADSIETNENEEKKVAIDGKTLRGAKRNPVHYVSAYDSTRGLLLGQVKTKEKSNEITAIPELLKVIDIKNALVTIDAMGCQKEICSLTRDYGGDYAIALKGNQGTLHAEAQNFFTQARNVNYKKTHCSRYSSSNKNHGRMETREIVLTHNLSWLDCKDVWKDLTSLIEVKSTRILKGKTSEEFRYYITSKKMTAKQASLNIRSHWSVENNLHWVLDVLFGDDALSANQGNAAENLGLFRRMAYCLLKQNTIKGRGLTSLQRKAAWNENYVLELLAKFIRQGGVSADKIPEKQLES